jgi:hypothetical protein
MNRLVSRAAWIVLVVVFGASVAGKLSDPAGFAFQLEALGIAMRWAWPLALGILFVELVIATGLLIRPWRRAAAGAAAILLLTFAAGLAWFLTEGKGGVDCGCFGALLDRRVEPLRVAENVLLSLVAFCVR